MKNLSKSKIVAYRQCPKRLWLEVHKPELREDSAATEATFARGNQVGDLARSLYDNGEGVLVDFNEVGFAKAFEMSRELLQGKRPIFEAGLSAGGALAFTDVMLPLHKRGKPKWKMVEVKSSTSVKDYYRDDVALQCYVAKNMEINLVEVSVACIDNQWVYPGKQNYQGLLYETDLTKEALSRYGEAKEWVDAAQKIVAKNKEPNVEVGDQCKDPFPCGFYAYCTRNEPVIDMPVTWLPRLTSKQSAYIKTNAVRSLKEIPDDLLNEIQLRVKQHTLKKKTFIDKKALQAQFTPQEYPAWFLDFETAQFAVPIWKGTRAYQQIPFQYSLHKVDKNGALSHKEFLFMEGENPARAFAEALIKDCENAGPIYVYNVGFEGRIINELIQAFPKLKTDLQGIKNRLVDLLPMARKHYYHPDQKGSWSIKAVLPTIPGLDASMDYKTLEGIQDGQAAAEDYVAAVTGLCSPEQKEKIKQQLLAYCKLDTLAMVKLWKLFAGKK